jgi:hypothetical protein
MRRGPLYVVALATVACGARTDLGVGDRVGSEESSGCVYDCTTAGFADSSSTLHGVSIPTGTVTPVAAATNSLYDIALSANGVLYAVSPDSLYTVDTTTAVMTPVAPLTTPCNALDFGPDGTLDGAQVNGSGVFTIDQTTGDMAQIATYPDGYESSGDLAVIGGQLFATVNLGDGLDDSLVSVDLTTFQGAVFGPTGYLCIYGLAADGDQLFGFTCNGEVLAIDTTTGECNPVASTGDHFYGASAR